MSKGIAGARGFIGSYLCRYLLSRAQGSLRLLIRGASEIPKLEGSDVFCGDLLSRQDCERFADGLKIIYYLAHVHTPVNSDYDLPNDALLNLVPLLNLLDAIQHLRTKPHIVYFSSGGAIYATDRRGVPYRETDPCAPLSSYGIQKLAAEEYLQLASSKGYLTAAVLRVGNAYGTLLPQHRTQGLIGVAVNRGIHGQPVRIFGSLANVRDYVHLEDVCAMAERASNPASEFTIVNVGSGIGHSVSEVLRVIEECHGHPLPLEVDERCGTNLPGWVVLDNTKARCDFGWQPTIDLRSGIEQLIAQSQTPSALAAAF